MGGWGGGGGLETDTQTGQDYYKVHCKQLHKVIGKYHQQAATIDCLRFHPPTPHTCAHTHMTKLNYERMQDFKICITNVLEMI